MRLRIRNLALSTGYYYSPIRDEEFSASFLIGFGLETRGEVTHYKTIIGAAWNWYPTFVWIEESWNCSYGVPHWVPGVLSSSWTGRSMFLDNWHWPFAWVLRRAK